MNAGTRPQHVKQEDKDRLTGTLVTLDGREAVVVGRLAPFASIATLQAPHYRIEVAWPTVERVCSEGGASRADRRQHSEAPLPCLAGERGERIRPFSIQHGRMQRVTCEPSLCMYYIG